MLMESFLSSKLNEFYSSRINKLSDKRKEVIQNDGEYTIDWKWFGVWIYETKLDNFYRSWFLDYCHHLFYIHNVSVDMSSGFLQVFLVKLGCLHGISNYILYLIYGVTCSDSVNHNRVQVLCILVLLLACSQDWACSLQMILPRK